MRCSHTPVPQLYYFLSIWEKKNEQNKTIFLFNKTGNLIFSVSEQILFQANLKNIFVSPYPTLLEREQVVGEKSLVLPSKKDNEFKVHVW